MPLWMKLINAIFIIIGILIKYLFFCKKNLGNEYLSGIKEGLFSKNKLTKSNTLLINSLKIEYLMIKNTIGFFK
jgi:hypothetical protein